MGPLTKREVFAHLLDLRECAINNDEEGFKRLARIILISRSPELKELYEWSKENGHVKKENLKKNFNRRAEAMEELIKVSYPCFQTGNFNSFFEFLPKLGV